MPWTMPVSKGWMSLVRPVGMILPGAVATTSTLPSDAHASATQKRAIMVAPIARPIGDGGVSAISSAAGRNASSYSPRRAGGFGNGTIVVLTDAMDACLEEVELCIAAIRADQLVMCTVLDDAASLDGDDAIGFADRRETVGDHEYRPVGCDPLHVLLDGPLAFVVECTRRLVEDQDARIGNECARDRDTLALPAG